ncbi:MAG TPA: hypothetical protein ENF51_01760 [Candidatus Aenigmarchaeota archaeon]|nr:hypothetical protein [Candidatus Aenigmarchaeota archaeon]
MPEKGVTFKRIEDVPKSRWEALAKKQILFGHQSVGFNILDGIRDVMREHPFIKLNIVETEDPKDFNAPVFAHFRVGRNTDPRSKCDSFAEVMEKVGEKVDIAFFKFCYVDVGAKTDIDEVFSYYTKTMDSLKKKYPKVTFVHFTVPLTVSRTTIKTRIKLLIGWKEIWEYDDNIRRNQFNELLRNEYGGKEPLFDLASIESTFPDGRRSFFKKGGKVYYSLVPDYTLDGGHLNELGRKIVAEQLLIFLANL